MPVYLDLPSEPVLGSSVVRGCLFAVAVFVFFSLEKGFCLAALAKWIRQVHMLHMSAIGTDSAIPRLPWHRFSSTQCVNWFWGLSAETILKIGEDSLIDDWNKQYPKARQCRCEALFGTKEEPGSVSIASR